MISPIIQVYLVSITLEKHFFKKKKKVNFFSFLIF